MSTAPILKVYRTWEYHGDYIRRVYISAPSHAIANQIRKLFGISTSHNLVWDREFTIPKGERVHYDYPTQSELEKML